MTITITDESLTGDILNSILIQIDNEIVTVKDIIAARVEAEVEHYNTKNIEYFKGLVKPSDAEKTLNGFKLKPNQKIDTEKQIYVALKAFQDNGFLVLIDNTQAESLEQQVLLEERTVISFLKLTPLIGG